jgi:hypothetical protein
VSFYGWCPFTVGVPADIQTEHLPNKVQIKISLANAMKTSGGVEV